MLEGNDFMPLPVIYDFPRYLAAKKSVDDRALNRQVWQALAGALPPCSPTRPLRILEVGAGIGTMLERMLDWELLGDADYTAIDASEENIATAGLRLQRRSGGEKPENVRSPSGLILERPEGRISVELEAIDLFDLIDREEGRRTWDLLAAHAFLDLMDIPTTLPRLFRLLRPGGLFYFTINFDGATLFEPVIDPCFDELIQALYHRTMDERVTGGQPSGDSRSGRHLFGHLKAVGAQILAAGASDWVVFPSPNGYPGDEAYFLHFIIHTIHGALAGHPELELQRLDAWAAERHAQIERCELVYIAHQMDFVGRRTNDDRRRTADRGSRS
jgi:SAM-dependent methyltransferase